MKANHAFHFHFAITNIKQRKDLYGQKPHQALKPYRSYHY